jgi:hypothetical protein
MSNEEEEEIRKHGVEDSAGFKNLVAVKDYTVKTRELLRNAEKQIEELKKLVVNQNLTIETMRAQISLMLVKIHGGGSTSLN